MLVWIKLVCWSCFCNVFGGGLCSEVDLLGWSLFWGCCARGIFCEACFAEAIRDSTAVNICIDTTLLYNSNWFLNVCVAMWRDLQNWGRWQWERDCPRHCYFRFCCHGKFCPSPIGFGAVHLIPTAPRSFCSNLLVLTLVGLVVYHQTRKVNSVRG